MRVGFVVDGQSEFRSLQDLIQCPEFEGHTILKPLYADMQPYASVAQISRAAGASIRILVNREAELIVLLIDHEDRDDCPGARAMEIRKTVGRTYGGFGEPTFAVVSKVTCYENWLVADPRAVNSIRGRFVMSAKDRRRVEPNMADHVDARAMLGRAASAKYEKVADSQRLARAATVRTVASNSRSFRRLLRVLRFPDYLAQSTCPY